jgi:hypothetical protein
VTLGWVLGALATASFIALCAGFLISRMIRFPNDVDHRLTIRIFGAHKRLLSNKAVAAAGGVSASAVARYL